MNTNVLINKPNLIILDSDLSIAVTYLSDVDIRRQINSAYHLLIMVYFERHGLKKKKIYQYLVKEGRPIIKQAFPCWPLTNYLEAPPKVKNKEYKFIKCCGNHFEYVLEYANLMCEEFHRRFGKHHPKQRLLEWIESNKLDLPSVHQDKYVVQYPITSIPIKFRRVDYITSARYLYTKLIEDPISEYNKVSVPDWFDLDSKLSER